MAYPETVFRDAEPHRMSRVEQLLARLSGRDPDAVQTEITETHRAYVSATRTGYVLRRDTTDVTDALRPPRWRR